ncbi:hypothetical protein C2W64_03107 [Brevibacillus laterosporus]|nr:hypothetical protein C2W64_03107 [Brevibacillus laterosporus]
MLANTISNHCITSLSSNKTGTHIRIQGDVFMASKIIDPFVYFLL